MHKTILLTLCLLIGAMFSLEAQNHSNKFSGQLMVGANYSFWGHPPANLFSNGFANKAKPADALPGAVLGMNLRMPVSTMFSVEAGLALAQRRGKARGSYSTYRLTQADWIQASETRYDLYFHQLQGDLWAGATLHPWAARPIGIQLGASFNPLLWSGSREKGQVEVLDPGGPIILPGTNDPVPPPLPGTRPVYDYEQILPKPLKSATWGIYAGAWYRLSKPHARNIDIRVQYRHFFAAPSFEREVFALPSSYYAALAHTASLEVALLWGLF